MAAYADGSSVVLEPGSDGSSASRRSRGRRFDERRRARSPPARPRVPRRGLHAALGQAVSWYLDKYRFETDPEVRTRARRSARRGRAGVRARGDPAREAGPRRGRVGASTSWRRSSFIIVRGETKEYGTANRIQGVFEQEGRAGVPPGGRRHDRRRSRRPSPPSAARACSSGTRSAWSIARRVDRTLSRASACGCARSSGREISLEMRKTAAKRHG